MNTLPQNFLGLEPPYSDYRKSRFVILPIPYDATTSFLSGTCNGPAAIITASQHVELFDDERSDECHEAGVATLEPLPVNQTGPEAMHNDIFTAAKQVVHDGKFLFGLGGEHSITSGLVRAVMSKHQNLSILQIDAHLDLRDSWQQEKHSHACVMRRCFDLGVKNIVPVGIRCIAREEHRFMNLKKINAITAQDCHTNDDWMDRVLNGLGETVYITIDIDGFDPAYAPGTGTPEPGGLDWYQVTGLLRRVCAEKHVVAADINEVMPVPGQAVTEFLAARLAYKLIGYVQ